MNPTAIDYAIDFMEREVWRLAEKTTQALSRFKESVAESRSPNVSVVTVDMVDWQRAVAAEEVARTMLAIARGAK